jgi:Holliday junction resolvase-like predicted endonuclease
MTSRQTEIAAEAFVASQLARCGYDVLVQYGANQPNYDLIAIKKKQIIPVSVKGSQDGGWALAVSKVKHVKNLRGNKYHNAIKLWLKSQRKDVVFFLVQFKSVPMNQPPRFWVARPREIAKHMKSQFNGNGNGALYEDYVRDHARSRYSHKIPSEWAFSAKRVAALASTISAK